MWNCLYCVKCELWEEVAWSPLPVAYPGGGHRGQRGPLQPSLLVVNYCHMSAFENNKVSYIKWFIVSFCFYIK